MNWKMLQLGHALSRVESSQPVMDLIFERLLQLGHALSRVERSEINAVSSETKTSFNWATRSRAWKASSLELSQLTRFQLQLGHALSRVERYLRALWS